MAFWNDPSALLPKQSHRWVISLDEHIPEDQKGDTIPHYFAKSADRPSYKIETIQAKYLYAHTFNFPKRVIWNPIKIEFNDIIILEEIEQNQFKDFIREPKIAGDRTKISSNYEENNSTLTKPVEYENIGKRETLFEDKTTKFKKLTSPFQIAKNKIYQKSTQLFFYQFLQKCGYFDPNELEREDQLLRFRSYHFKKNMVGALNGQNVNLLDNNSTTYDKDFIVLSELDDDGNVIEYWKIYNPIITDVSTGKLDYSSDNILSITVGLSYDWAELVPLEGKYKPDNKLKIDDEITNDKLNEPIKKPKVATISSTGVELDKGYSFSSTGVKITRNTTIINRTPAYSVDINNNRIPGTTVPPTNNISQRLQTVLNTNSSSDEE